MKIATLKRDNDSWCSEPKELEALITQFYLKLYTDDGRQNPLPAKLDWNLNDEQCEIVDARNQRLKRAMDLSLKHVYLPKDLQAMQTPFRSYLQDMLALVKKERAEREALGALPLYQRTIP
ncbi:cytochrome b-c1 complex subunit 7-2 [Herrania umbratica]|uniref:Cytochrome b-c1 complex subunit 7-2 n=1 Tax=Herrania umbratica TaxID=108875 RepID=A0A6J0ZLE0_9ROSI|nr:cytochrome b-c1 complex subunit 7-2 [Herrania umbratica]